MLALLAASAYVDYSQAQSTQNLNNEISGYLDEIASLQANNTALQNTITELRATVTSLNSQVGSLQATIATLQSQITNLQAQLAALRAPKLIGNFTWSNSCPVLGNCTYIASGSYANVGTLTARGASVTFNFYSMPNSSGKLLCSTQVSLGDVPGRFIDNMWDQSCSGSSATMAQSMDYQFHLG